MSSDIILQVQKPGGDFTCEQYSGIPSSQSIFIAICYPDDATSPVLAQELKDSFTKSLSSLDVNVKKAPPKCGGEDNVPFMDCHALKIAANRKILLVVSSNESASFT